MSRLEVVLGSLLTAVAATHCSGKKAVHVADAADTVIDVSDLDEPDSTGCTPSCAGRECGDDGCWGSCGVCSEGQECTPTGSCCIPNCVNAQCGEDGCFGLCGKCMEAESCVDGSCCSRLCAGLSCGPDGCGGSCGSCAAGSACQSGSCVESPDECWDGDDESLDGCDGTAISPVRVNVDYEMDQYAHASILIGQYGASRQGVGRVAVAWLRDTESTDEIPGTCFVIREMDPVKQENCIQAIKVSGMEGHTEEAPATDAPLLVQPTWEGLGVALFLQYQGMDDWDEKVWRMHAWGAGKCSYNSGEQLIDSPFSPKIGGMSSAGPETMLFLWGNKDGAMRFASFAPGVQVTNSGAVAALDEMPILGDSLAMADAGGQKVAVFWARPLPAGGSHVEGGLFNRQMEPVVTPLVLQEQTGWDASEPDALSLASGQVLVVSSAKAASGTSRVVGRLLGGKGEWATAPFTLAESDTHSFSAPAVAEVNAGLLAVAWLKQTPGEGSSVECSLVTPTGDMVVPQIVLDASPDVGRISSPEVVELGDSTFSVLWKRRLPEGAFQDQAILLQRLNAQGGRMWGQCNDGLCGPAETSETCPKDCGPPGTE